MQELRACEGANAQSEFWPNHRASQQGACIYYKLHAAKLLAHSARVLCLWIGDASMTSNSDDLEEQLGQNLRLRRELGAEIAKARESNAKPERPELAQATDSSVKQDDKTGGAQQYRPPELTITETRQGTGLRAVFWVVIGSAIAGLALGLAFGWIPVSWTVRP